MSASGGKQTFLGSGVEGVAGVVGEDCPSRTWFVRDSYLQLVAWIRTTVEPRAARYSGDPGPASRARPTPKGIEWTPRC
jgi:hypothetical protein